MASDFMDRFRFNMENVPDVFYIRNLKKKPTETFCEYATRWRSEAAKVRPVLEEEQINKFFVRDQDLQLKATGYVTPIPAATPKNPSQWFNPNKSCAYHSYMKGHTIDECRSLKDKIQALIETKIILEKEPSLNVCNNPLPDHKRGDVHMIEIGDDWDPESLNICPLVTLKKFGKVLHEIKDEAINVKDFDGSQRSTIGEISLCLQMGPTWFDVDFQVIDVPASNNLLLGRPWIHVSRAVASTLHQAVMFEWIHEEVIIHGDGINPIYSHQTIPSIEGSRKLGGETYHHIEQVNAIDKDKWWDNKIESILNWCGYEPGKGLGKNLQAIAKPIKLNKHCTTFGLGYEYTWEEFNYWSPPWRGPYYPLEQPIPHLEQTFQPADVINGSEEEEALAAMRNLFLKDNDMDYSKEDEIPEEVVKEVDNFENRPKSNLDETEIVNLGDAENVKETRISVHLSPSEKKEYTEFLREYEYIFAWSYNDMTGLSTSIVAQKLPTNPTCPPVKKKLRKKATDHMEDLRKFFNRLRRYNLKLNPAKCAFGVIVGKLLRFIVSYRGIELDPSKVKAIQELPSPKYKKDVMSFLGRLNYISRFIAQSTVICELIFKMLKKDTATKWADDFQRAFDRIKEYLSTPPVLVPLEPAIKGQALADQLAENPVDGEIQNEFADALATLSSMIQHPDKNFVDLILVKIHDQLAYCAHIEEEAGRKPWFDDIKEYLTKGKYLELANPTQKRTLQRLSNNFFHSGGVLYSRTPDLGLLMCVNAKEASRLLEEIHVGTCGPHMNGFIFAKKIFGAGYFWMTMETDCIQYVQKYHRCQIHADMIKIPPS
ncbi:uncharacterized protein [Nicotiana sylvestris]|uniref:uncharacterized protein n=1 Tax=Nicotiana sylvestris TaxID=4096 RepID=UPI00388CB46F